MTDAELLRRLNEVAGELPSGGPEFVDVIEAQMRGTRGRLKRWQREKAKRLLERAEASDAGKS